jgi:hypothetical protein
VAEEVLGNQRFSRDQHVNCSRVPTKAMGYIRGNKQRLIAKLTIAEDVFLCS